MLAKAAEQYSGQPTTKPRKPLHPIMVAVNIAKLPESNKRKLDRAMSNTSSLGALHESTYFYNENDFDDDAAIDLTGPSPPRATANAITYPTLPEDLTSANYPTLPPPPPSQKNQAPPSSAPVPWSSSPPTHLEPRPSKRRTVPWLDKDGNDKSAAFTPLPANQAKKLPYPWNKTASAMKDELGELRRRNKQNRLQNQPQASADLIRMPTGQQVHLIQMSDEQRGILKMVEEGKSVFFTGSAGTGKSVLMRQIIQKLRDKYKREPDRVAVTASTGLAACNIEGMTLHSFAGIGLGKEPAPELVKKIKKNIKNKTRWQRTKVLIIDEISMVDGDLYDKLEHIARTIKSNGRPFGGIQLVVTGDFFQLPPVPDRNTTAKFAFDATTWNTTITLTILLNHVFRQKDPAFANMLNEMRLGKLTPTTIKSFQQLSRPLQYEDELTATELFPTRNEVENANRARMNLLSGAEMSFPAVDSGMVDEATRSRLLENCIAPTNLILKKGAQVMLIKNIDSQLVNGSQGTVTSFMDEACYHAYSEDPANFVKSQEDGSDDEIAAAKKRIQQLRHKDGTSTGTGRLWPLVRFTLADNTCRSLLCVPEEWKSEAPNRDILAKRMQVPLILAWALSIHKAQGQTIERVKVDLGRVFEKGQAYVALSRATTQAGLQVTRFDPRKVMVHPRVKEFYEGLTNVESILERKGEYAGKPRMRGGAIEVVDLDGEEEEEEDEEILRHMYA